MATISQLAMLADLVYGSNTAQDLPAGVTRKDSPSATASSGFAGAVYVIGGMNVITFRGTDKTDAADWLHNLTCHTTLSAQFDQALRFANNAKANHGLDANSTIICGHSLGGGLTKYVSHNMANTGWSPCAAISFNGPGLTAGAYERGLALSLGLGIAAIHSLVSRTDSPSPGNTNAKIANINIVGDQVSEIGITAGRIYRIPPTVAGGGSDPYTCHIMSTVRSSIAATVLANAPATAIV